MQRHQPPGLQLSPSEELISSANFEIKNGFCSGLSHSNPLSQVL
jgi:hypothetical protein